MGNADKKMSISYRNVHTSTRTFRDLGWRYRHCFEGPSQLWRVHNHPSQSTCGPKDENDVRRGWVWDKTKDLLHLHKDVLVGWKFAISGEQLLLLGAQFLQWNR